MRDGRDVEYGIRLGQGVVAGVVAERAFVAQRLARIKAASDDEVGLPAEAYGELDDVQFYNRILSAAEVVQAMNLGPSISFSRAGNQLTSPGARVDLFWSRIQV